MILDNLISEGRIPPLVALLIGNAPDARDRELPCNPEFSQALVTELLPWAHGLFNFTSDPHHAVLAGSSAGGLAAACSGLWHPDVFGNVLAQSGAFHWTPTLGSDSKDSNLEPNWVARQFISGPRKPLRFYLDAGSAEFNAKGSADSTLFCTRTLRDVLRAKEWSDTPTRNWAAVAGLKVWVSSNCPCHLRLSRSESKTELIGSSPSSAIPPSSWTRKKTRSFWPIFQSTRPDVSVSWLGRLRELMK